MTFPTVSIVMPTYNSGVTVSESIESVISQSYTDWELIVVDDCSQDNTVSIVSDYERRDERIKLIVLDCNSGAGRARNRAIEEARGRFISFLDSDDLWHESKLDKQLHFMLQHNYSLTYSNYQKFSSRGFAGVVRAPLSTTYKKLLYGNVIGCLTAVYDTDVLGKRYMPLIRKRQDMALWLSILQDVDKAHCIDEVLAFYRTDTGMTKNKVKIIKEQWTFYRKTMGFGLSRSFYYFVFYSINGFAKSFA